MPETPQEYRRRIIENLQGQSPLRVQATTAGKLGRLVAGASRHQLAKRPAAGKWSTNEIVAHLAECEIVFGYRLRKILCEPGSPIQGFDQDKWAAAGNYVSRDARKSLALFRSVRAANLDLLNNLAPDQWQRTGMHSERGEESIETVAAMMAGHDLNHLRQVESLVGKKRAKER